MNIRLLPEGTRRWRDHERRKGKRRGNQLGAGAKGHPANRSEEDTHPSPDTPHPRCSRLQPHGRLLIPLLDEDADLAIQVQTSSLKNRAEESHPWRCSRSEGGSPPEGAKRKRNLKHTKLTKI